MKKPLSKELIFVIAFFSGVAVIAIGIFAGIALFGTKTNTESPTHSVVQTPPEPTKDDMSTYNDSLDTKAVAEQSTANSSIVIDDELQYNLNIFMSNFSEAGINSFSDRLSDKELIDFGLMHNHLNKDDATVTYADEAFDYQGSQHHSSHKINYKYIAQSVEKFFGITLSESNFFNHPFYKNGNVYCVCANKDNSKNLSQGFSVVDSFKSLGNGLYSLSFSIYNDGAGNLDKTLYKNSPSDMNGANYQYVGSGTATLSIGKFSNRDTYQLKSYSVNRH